MAVLLEVKKKTDLCMDSILNPSKCSKAPYYYDSENCNSGPNYVALLGRQRARELLGRHLHHSWKTGTTYCTSLSGGVTLYVRSNKARSSELLYGSRQAAASAAQ